MLKIDFGSGYNPKKGYKTCDMTLSPYLDFISKDNKIYDKKGEIQKNSVDVIHCRNTLYEVKEVELKYEVFMSNPDPNERFLMKAEDFNAFLEKERNKPNKLKWVKPEVREDILTRCVVDENAIRKMVFAKYKNLDDFFNGLMEMEGIHGQ